MAFEAFNSVGGYSVGIPPTPVINANGIATLPGLQVSGISNLGSINNVIILGGVDGYYLQTNGEGGLTWAPAGNGGGGNGVPGGSNSEVQYNNNGNFGGDAGFAYNNVTNQLSISGNLVSTNVVASSNVSATNFVATGNISGANLNVTKITATGNISAGNAQLGNYAAANFYAGNGYLLSGVTSLTANYANFAGNITASNQPNIRSLGTLVNLTVSGNAILGNVSNVYVYGGISGQVLTTNGNGILSWQSAPAASTATYVTANYQPNITSTGTLTSLDVNGISNLGNVGNVKITGGSNGYVLSTDGNGNLIWAVGSESGGIGGSNTQIQYNNNGNFAADANFTYDTNVNTVTVAGNLVANSLTIGYGSFEFSHSNVFFATTNSATPDQPILTIPAQNLAAVQFTIISTDTSASIRNFVKLSAVIIGSLLNYNEISTLPINGYVGDFTINYDPGNIVIAPSVVLKLSPQSANSMSHRLMVTTYIV
jgi:hypothetical protein